MPAGEDSIEKPSISRRAPLIPRPRPVGDLIPSVQHVVEFLDTRPVVVHADDQALRPRVERRPRIPPTAAPAYRKALRAISDTAVAIRVWSGGVEVEQTGDLGGVSSRRDHMLIVIAG